MEKITDKIAALPPDANYFSLEFFPPKTQMVGLSHTPAFGQFASDIETKLTMVAHTGICQFAGPFGAYGTGAAPALRYSYLGCWWKHGGEVAGVGGDMPEAVTADDMLTLDMHEYESRLGGSGARGSEGAWDQKHPSAAR
jgi:hypothetical protein